MRPLARILWLWRACAPSLALGALVTLGALAAGIGLMAVAGRTVAAAVVAGVLLAPLALRWLGVARVVLRYLERLVTHEATFRALADLRVWFFRGLAISAAGGLGYRQAGDVLARLVGDVEALDGLYLRILLPLAGAVCVLPGLAVLLGMYTPALAVVVCVLFALASFLLPWLAARTTAEAGSALAAAASGLRIAALDALTGLREVRAFGAEGRMLALVQARQGVLLGAQRDAARRSALAGAAALLCGQAAVLAALLTAGAHPAEAVAAAFLIVAAFEAVGGLPRAGALAGHAAAAARRVLEAAEAPPPVPEPKVSGQRSVVSGQSLVDNGQETTPPPLAGGGRGEGSSLRFEHISFRWQPAHPLVLDGLTLDVPAGARVAVLGPSGAGKSTLAALALKLAAPQSGRVLLGATDLAALPAAVARAQIGWLSQATHLFDDTIRNNLLLARPEADDDGLWAALDAARVGVFVRSLPDGPDTWLGEAGARVSGGQGRRLALARALLSPAPILILDEPCAGLDAETERAFLATLNEVAAGRTLLLIAHRLAGVERLDRIYRLSGGKAVAAAG